MGEIPQLGTFAVDTRCSRGETRFDILRRAQRPLGVERANLVFDKSYVVGNVIGNSLQQNPQGHRSLLRMLARSLKIRFAATSQNRQHLCTDRVDEGNFIRKRTLLAVQSRYSEIWVELKQRRMVLHQHAFHAIRVDDLGVCQMANHLADRPFSWSWSQVPRRLRKRFDRLL